MFHMSPRSQPDPRALEVARNLQDCLPDHCRVVLFGSRATGDWTVRSDLDLAVIGLAGRSNLRAKTRVWEQAEILAGRSLQPPPEIHINLFSRPEFGAYRTSWPHLAGQVQAHGLDVNGRPLPPVSQTRPWPGVRELVHAIRGKVVDALAHMAEGSEATALHNMAKALDLTFKAGLGLLGGPWGPKCDMASQAARLLRRHPTWRVGSLTDRDLGQLSALIDLDDVHDFVEAGQVPWPDKEPAVLLAEVQDLCSSILAGVLSELGRLPSDVGCPDGEACGPSDFPARSDARPLLGWEDMSPHWFTRSGDVPEGTADGFASGGVL